MQETMTWVGMDVHARSTHAAAVVAATGELRRVRFGVGSESVVAWLSELPAPVRACYEAGPTGYALARAAHQAGVSVDVIAPSKTPRAPGERIKTDRRDAELLVRLLMAGQLRPVAIPTPRVEALRDLTRARDRIRGDLLRARHRVSKLLLRYGRVWPSDRGTWTQQHDHWLRRQRFDDPNLELAYVDALAAVDALVRRRDLLDQRLLVAAQDADVADAVARLRAFRGINTLTALGLHAEIHERPTRRHARFLARLERQGVASLAVPAPALAEMMTGIVMRFADLAAVKPERLGELTDELVAAYECLTGLRT